MVRMMSGSGHRTGPGVPAAPRRVRVAVWGLGHHARIKILPAIAACPSTELVGVSTRNEEVARAEAAKFGCRVWASPEEMLASADVDAIYLATPIGLHAAQGSEVLAARKHLWSEKSLARTPTECAELIELSRRNQRCVCEAFMYLYHPQFERVAELVSQERDLGRVVSIICRFSMPLLEHPGFRHTPELGGGALLDVGCYPLSLALCLTGSEPQVLAKGTRNAPGFDVDLSGYAMLEFLPSTVAYLEWGYGRAYLNDVTVAGEQGSLYADRIFSKPDGWNAAIEVRDARGTKHTEDVPAANAFARMLETFAQATTDEALQERLRVDAELQARSLGALAPTR